MSAAATTEPYIACYECERLGFPSEFTAYYPTGSQYFELYCPECAQECEADGQQKAIG